VARSAVVRALDLAKDGARATMAPRGHAGAEEIFQGMWERGCNTCTGTDHRQASTCPVNLNSRWMLERQNCPLVVSASKCEVRNVASRAEALVDGGAGCCTM
jgi:hypothetical protein